MTWKQILARARQGATKTGIPLEVYLAHVAAGEAWCSGHRDFHPLSEFGSKRERGGERRRTSCREWHARYDEPRWKMAQRQAARRSGHTGRCLGPTPEIGCYLRWGRLDHRHCACGEAMAATVQVCGRCQLQRPRAA